MARKLKTFLTSIGFFEQAVAAPSMKAALQAWGSEKNLFHQGFAKETSDPAIVAATMAKPGVVLRRAVGSKGAFSTDARLSKSLPGKPSKEYPKLPRNERKAGRAKTSVVSVADARAAIRATAAYEKEQARREKEEEKKEATRRKERKRRDVQVRRADAALEAAEQRHDEKLAAITRDRDALSHREKAEDERWQKEKKRLQQDRDRI